MDLALGEYHPALTPFCLEKLRNCGITNVKQLLRQTTDQLHQITGLSPRNLDDVRDAIIIRLQESAADLSKSLGQIQKYATGLSSLDNLLSGGLEEGSLNEFIGFTSSGKTYLTQTLCLRLLYGHDQLRALIITNSSRGCGSSLTSILQSLKIDSDTIEYLLKRVTLSSFADITSLHLILSSLLRSTDPLPPSRRIILLDGLSSELLKQYMAYDKVFNWQVYDCIQMLRRMALEHRSVILLTNLTMARNEVGVSSERGISASFSEATDRDWPSFMDNRFLITRSSCSQTSLSASPAAQQLDIKILKSRHLVTGRSCTLSLTEHGIE